MTLVCLLILVISSLITKTFGGDNTIKVCTKDGAVHQVSSKSCSRGAWASDPLQVSCVCVKGLWLLSEKFCDKEFFIISSIENECFKIDRPVSI